MDTDSLAAVIVETLAVVVAHPGIGLEDMTLRSPSPVVGSAQPTIDSATRSTEPQDG